MHSQHSQAQSGRLSQVAGVSMGAWAAPDARPPTQINFKLCNSNRNIFTFPSGLQLPPDHVLIDGNMLPRDLTLPATPLVKGDARSLSIAAASIVAKICRDRIMVDLAQQHPGYGWETNMGYPSKSHKAALENLGVTPHHRRSFKPVHNILYQGKIVSD